MRCVALTELTEEEGERATRSFAHLPVVTADAHLVLDAISDRLTRLTWQPFGLRSIQRSSGVWIGRAVGSAAER